MKLVQMPMLTHFLGQCVDAGEGHGPSRLLKELSLTKALIGQLPRASHVYIKHHRETTNTIAFQALGFQTDVQFTAEIAPAAEDLLWLGMRDKTGNVIRRAQERFELLENLQPAAFTALYDEHLTEKRRSNYYDPRICTAVIAECVRRGAGRVLAARDADGSVKAAIFTVWDETAEYYLMSTRARSAGNGAVSLLAWNAITHAARRNLVFDFDGLYGHGDAQFFAGFGGTLKPRLISYYNARVYKVVDRFRRKN